MVRGSRMDLSKSAWWHATNLNLETGEATKVEQTILSIRLAREMH